MKEKGAQGRPDSPGSYPGVTVGLSGADPEGRPALFLRGFSVPLFEEVLVL